MLQSIATVAIIGSLACLMAGLLAFARVGEVVPRPWLGPALLAAHLLLLLVYAIASGDLVRPAWEGGDEPGCGYAAVC